MFLVSLNSFSTTACPPVLTLTIYSLNQFEAGIIAKHSLVLSPMYQQKGGACQPTELSSQPGDKAALCFRKTET